MDSPEQKEPGEAFFGSHLPVKLELFKHQAEHKPNSQTSCQDQHVDDSQTNSKRQSCSRQSSVMDQSQIRLVLETTSSSNSDSGGINQNRSRPTIVTTRKPRYLENIGLYGTIFEDPTGEDGTLTSWPAQIPRSKPPQTPFWEDSRYGEARDYASVALETHQDYMTSTTPSLAEGGISLIESAVSADYAFENLHDYVHDIDPDEALAEHMQAMELLDCSEEDPAKALRKQQLAYYRSKHCNAPPIEKPVDSPRLAQIKNIIEWERFIGIPEARRATSAELCDMDEDEFDRFYEKVESAYNQNRKEVEPVDLLKKFQDDELQRYGTKLVHDQEQGTTMPEKDEEFSFQAFEDFGDEFFDEDPDTSSNDDAGDNEESGSENEEEDDGLE
ncbi:hypothetical protein B0J11DRAFT_614398 [Dendryphion nanum]|uniref:Uncharacterized protein n=1 Tax=Dendryphion nanum TaxID=256645 RepID=A0A9P9DY10_9PLEO|nr:hypothetical protein B0J11DRAFT_614398 [Dendryphion nanum]